MIQVGTVASLSTATSSSTPLAWDMLIGSLRPLHITLIGSHRPMSVICLRLPIYISHSSAASVPVRLHDVNHRSLVYHLSMP
jgi:hypothetical protein